MCVNRSVLYDDVFRHTDSERGEIPQGADASGQDTVCNLLRYLDGYRDDGDRGVIFFLFSLKIIDMEYGNSIDGRSDDFGTHVEAGYDIHPVLIEPRVAHQSSPKASDTEEKGLMLARKTEEVFENID